MGGLDAQKRQKLAALIGILPDKAVSILMQAVEAGQASGDTSLPYDELLTLLSGKVPVASGEPDYAVLFTARAQEPLLPFVSAGAATFAQPIAKDHYDILWARAVSAEGADIWEKALADFTAAIKDENEDDADKAADRFVTTIGTRLQELLTGSPKALKKEIPAKDVQTTATLFAGLCLGAKPLRQKLRKLPPSFEIRTPDDVAAWRRHYEDLSRCSSEAALYFFCLAVSRMPRPSQVFKVVSEAAGGRSERFVSETELSAVGGFIAIKAEELLGMIEAYNPSDDVDKIKQVVSAVDQFNLISIDLEAAFGSESRGPWSVTIMKMCSGLGRRMDDYFKETLKAFDQAFPSDRKQLLPRVFAVIPRVKGMPNDGHITRIMGYAHLVAGLRNVSSALGFGTARSKVASELEKKAEEYANNLVDLLRDDEIEDKDAIRAYIEAVAAFLAVMVNEETGSLLRRRAAA